MYDGIRGGGSYWYSIFFVACVGLGQFVVLNLFLAVLLGNIDMIVSCSLSIRSERVCGGYPASADHKKSTVLGRPMPMSSSAEIKQLSSWIGAA